jgi:hypothetical protein
MEETSEFILGGEVVMSYVLTVDVSSIYEFLNSFLSFTDPRWTDNLDLGRSWLTETRAKLLPQELAAFDEFTTLNLDNFDLLMAWAVRRKPKMRVLDFLDYLEYGDKEIVYAEVLGLMPHLENETIAFVLKRYIPLLRVWYDKYFRGIEAEHEHYLREDVLEKKTLESKVEPADLIELATSGIFVGDHLPIDEVVLLPTLHLRPLNTYCFFHRLLVLQYPIDWPEKDGLPSNVLLRLTQALAEPFRLQLLRFIAQHGPISLPELQEALSEYTDDFQINLRQLRAAGLLRIHLEEMEMDDKYSIRLEGVSDLQIFLEAYLQV